MKINKKICLRIVFSILLLITFVIIFMFSNQNGEKSTGLSQNLIINILKIFTNNTNKIESITKMVEPFIRKLAHFSIYTLVGIWSFCLMKTFRIKKKSQIGLSFFIGFFYACTDELHQFFISDRMASAFDVLIDSFGVLFGILIVEIIIKAYFLIRKK